MINSKLKILIVFGTRPEAITDLSEFKKISGVIVANCHAGALDDVAHKVYSRDLFGND